MREVETSPNFRGLVHLPGGTFCAPIKISVRPDSSIPTEYVRPSFIKAEEIVKIDEIVIDSVRISFALVDHVSLEGRLGFLKSLPGFVYHDKGNSITLSDEIALDFRGLLAFHEAAEELIRRGDLLVNGSAPEKDGRCSVASELELNLARSQLAPARFEQFIKFKRQFFENLLKFPQSPKDMLPEFQGSLKVVTNWEEDQK